MIADITWNANRHGISIEAFAQIPVLKRTQKSILCGKVAALPRVSTDIFVTPIKDPIWRISLKQTKCETQYLIRSSPVLSTSCMWFQTLFQLFRVVPISRSSRRSSYHDFLKVWWLSFCVVSQFHRIQWTGPLSYPGDLNVDGDSPIVFSSFTACFSVKPKCVAFGWFRSMRRKWRGDVIWDRIDVGTFPVSRETEPYEGAREGFLLTLLMKRF
jgi:hypothetical protein